MEDGLSDTVSELLPEVSVTQPGDFGDGALAILQNAMPYASSALLSSLRAVSYTHLNQKIMEQGNHRRKAREKLEANGDVYQDQCNRNHRGQYGALF